METKTAEYKTPLEIWLEIGKDVYRTDELIDGTAKAYADQQCKSERNKVLDEAIEVFMNLHVWTEPTWKDVIAELRKLKLKQP